MNKQNLPKTQIPSIKHSAKKHHSNSLNKNTPSQTNIITHIQNPTSSIRAFSTPKNNNAPIFKSNLLPPQSPQHINKKTLLLDLDETLVHSSFIPFDKSDIILKVEFDDTIYNIHVLVRPDVNEFLIEVSKYYEIVIFTASLSNYASPLVDIIDQHKVCLFRLYREHCTFVNGMYVKDLKRVGRDMKNVILLDNSPISYAFTVENGLPILSWFCDKKDKELMKYVPILKFLSQVDDVRKYIKQFVNEGELNYAKTMKIIENYYNKQKDEKKEEVIIASNPNDNNIDNNNKEQQSITKTRWFKGTQSKYQKNEEEIQKQDYNKHKKNKIDLILKNSLSQYNTNVLTSKHSSGKNTIFSKETNTLFSGANTVKNETSKVTLQNNFFPLKFKQHKKNYISLVDQANLGAFPILNNTNNNRMQIGPISQRVKMQNIQFKLKLSNSNSYKILDIQHSNNNKGRLTINKIERSRSTGGYNGLYMKPKTPKISSHNSFSNLNRFYFDGQDNKCEGDKSRISKKNENLLQRTATAQFRKKSFMK